jgi:ABC-2 type transport system ATP-binding protein
MCDIILETKAICKSYKGVSALSDVSISIKKGRIYGFIGENGAGKTTLLRIITGLTMPTSGELILFGKNDKSNLEKGRRQIGNTIESPALHPNFTAEVNLELQRNLIDNSNKNIIHEVLQLVRLSDVRKKKVKNYSMGMKQRLGIALSLLGNPKMLVLDEPVNGLDPTGIVKLRRILKKLNTEQGITILMSSHILNEMQLLATDFLIIHKGRIINTMTREDMERKCRRHISIRLNDVHTGLSAIQEELHTSNYEIDDNGMVLLYDYISELPAVAEVLRRHNILVTHIALSEQTLEDFYLSITGGKNHA